MICHHVMALKWFVTVLKVLCGGLLIYVSCGLPDAHTLLCLTKPLPFYRPPSFLPKSSAARAHPKAFLRRHVPLNTNIRGSVVLLAPSMDGCDHYHWHTAATINSTSATSAVSIITAQLEYAQHAHCAAFHGPHDVAAEVLLRLLCTTGSDSVGKSCGSSAACYSGWLGLRGAGYHLHCAQCQSCALEGYNHPGPSGLCHTLRVLLRFDLAGTMFIFVCACKTAWLTKKANASAFHRC